MKNKRKMAVFCIIILLIGTVITPTIIGQLVNTRVIYDNKSEYYEKPHEIVAIQVYQYLGNGSTRIVKEIPLSEALELVEKIQTIEDTSTSINESFEQTLDTLKDAGLISNEITVEDITNGAKEKWKNVDTEMLMRIFGNQNSNDDEILNLFCKLKFLLTGFGVVVGSHSLMGTFGADVFGFFYGWGTVSAYDGLFEDKDLSIGWCSGFFLGFIGFLIKILFPPVYGPVVFGVGVAGVTHWKSIVK